jgi:predicted transcriptional regulator
MIGLVLCLRAARSVLGWSQTQLATKAGISKPALNRLERFENAPRLDTVTRIQEALAEAGVRIEHRENGEFGIAINHAVVRDMAERIEAGESVTSRGKVGGVKEVKTRSITKEQMERFNKKG